MIDPLTGFEQSFTQSPDGTPIFYATRGGGLPLVLCDGIGCAGYVWHYVLEDFASGYRLVRWHYRGHGRSPAPADMDRLAIADLCADLKAVMDAAGVDRAVLAGHSMGVQVILEFHRQFPDRVLGLVPVCGSHGNPLRTFRGTSVLERIFPAIKSRGIKYKGAINTVLRHAVNTDFAFKVAALTEINPKLVKKEVFMPYLEHMAQMDAEVFLRMMGHAGNHSARDHLPGIRVPVLIVAAEHDQFTPPELSQEMAAAIPGAELIELPGGTHTGPIEWPELMNLRLRRWLERHFPATGGATG